MPNDAAFNLTDLPIVDLRNGALGTITAITPSTAIPAKYYWAQVAAVPRDEIPSFAELDAQATYTNMIVADSGMNAADARKRAIVLSGIRTGMRIFYALDGSDLSTGECAPRAVNYRAATAQVGTPGATGFVAAKPAGADTNFGGSTTTAATAAWSAWTALSVEESVILKWHIVLGAAVLPTQGWSIVKNGHHFLSEAGASAKAGYTAVTRQFRSKAPAEVMTFIENAQSWWEDVAYHKAGHPVLMSLKIEVAGHSDTAARLKAADWGSAAVRLPATSPDFEYAKLIKAVLIKVAPILTVLGATIDYTGLDTAMNAVFATNDIKVRSAAIAYATALAHTQDPTLAVAAGVLLYLVQDQPTNTLTKSYGFKRLVNEYPAEVNLGGTLGRAYTQRQRDAIAAGDPISIRIVFSAPAPASAAP